MTVLKKLTDPNGNLLPLIPGSIARVSQYLKGGEEFNLFKEKVLNKFYDGFKNVAQLIQTTENPNEWMFFTGNITPGDEPIANEIRINVTAVNAEKRVEVNSFISKFNLFICNETGDQGGHTFAIKKSAPGIFEIIDPQGTQFSEKELGILATIFSPTQRFQESKCPLQIKKAPTCALWSLLLIAYADYSAEQIQKMIETIKQQNGLNAENGNEIVLLTIFDKFLEQGFATPTEIASYEGKFKGLGRKKCRKCGLPKA